MKNILITGGAGYIGSITAWELKKAGFNPVIYDSLEKGHQKAVAGLDLIVGKTHDTKLLTKTLKDKKIDGVIHFAAYIEVEESMREPYRYFDNNFGGSLHLLEAMRRTGVNKIVFSSTAAVYGQPQVIPIKESQPKQPTNAYGQSKLMTEEAIDWFHRIHGLSYIILRYFNAAGASLDGTIGESHQPETHLIPNIINSISHNKRHSREGGILIPFKLFGTDYPTPDGTCVRDYIHVLDLARYHILALQYLDQGKPSIALNAGTGKGLTNRQVLKTVEAVTGTKVPVLEKDRRAGDAPELVADNGLICQTLGYTPQYSDLTTIVETAWKWYKNKRY